ncbi:MAG: TlpA family protein disulfide reductase [Methylotenera sp.]|nr:TlpA family protein disulfide reductase [Methylotenera sp.]
MSDSLKKTLLAIVIIGLLAFFAIQLQAKNNLPHVVFTTLSGKKIAAADLKSKVLLVNFWATDCLSCIKEMPELVRIYNAYHAQGLELIAIAMPDDPPAQVLNYVTKKEIPFPVMHDGLSEMVEKFGGVNLTPTLFIYDKQGKLLQRSVGALDFVKLDQLLSAALR